MSYIITDLISYIYTKINQLNFKIKLYYIFSKKLFQMQNMSVLKFYKGKIILITGTSGFLGKVILEKCLRVLPDVEKIFLLIRSKSGESS